MLEVSFAAVTSAAHDQVRLSPHNTRSAVAEAGRNDCCKSHDYACYKFDIGAGDPKGICMPENPQPVSAGVAVPGGGGMVVLMPTTHCTARRCAGAAATATRTPPWPMNNLTTHKVLLTRATHDWVFAGLRHRGRPLLHCKSRKPF